MKAIITREFGTADSLELTTLPIPSIKEDEVLVQVKAISINPVDIKTAIGKGMSGRIKEFLPVVLGWDISGVVTEVGKNVTAFKKGDAVFGMVNFPGLGNAYAEYVAAPAGHLALKPSNISHEAAAAATLAALTAWQAFTQQVQVKAGQKILIHAAAGGVGHYAVQIAKHLGAYVIGTSSAKNKDLVLSLGADEHIDYTSVHFEDAVKDVDIVLDAIGGENAARSVDVVKQGGTIISIPSGVPATGADKAKEKDVHLFFFLVSSSGKDMQEIATLLEQGKLRSHVSRIFPFEEMKAAHEVIASGRAQGKIIITI
ncbi:MAG: NADP-dependent oxidoreductase [Filimonas sp.]|nr:NADP-dependent oxidoreductase [Filimonas sp.]